MIKKLLYTLLLIVLPLVAFSGTYTVPITTTEIDGDTYCDGTCDSTDTIVIEAGDSGTHNNGGGAWCSGTDGSNDAKLCDKTQSWTTDEFVDFVILNLTDNSLCKITANDATSITCTLDSGTDNFSSENDWDDGDEYAIARDGLRVTDFKGNTDYINIVNEDTDTPVYIVPTAQRNQIKDSNYVYWRGNNDAEFTYGFVVIYEQGQITGNNYKSNVFKVTTSGTTITHHLKIAYTKLDFEQTDFDNSSASSGFQITCAQYCDPCEDPCTSYTHYSIIFEHNFVNHPPYAGFYLGPNHCNKPSKLSTFWISDITVRYNTVEDAGHYSGNIKSGDASVGHSNIYGNTFRRTGLWANQKTGPISVDYEHALKAWGPTQHPASGAYVDFYHNWIEDTYAACVNLGEGDHRVYENICVGAGAGDWSFCDNVTGPGCEVSEEQKQADMDRWNSGIFLYFRADYVDVNDNLIVQPDRYGIRADASVGMSDNEDYRNLICDAGKGERYDAGSMTERSGADANVYHSDCASFLFNTWSDDSDYSNDRFRSRNLWPPASATGVGNTADLTWKNSGDVTGVDVFFDKDTNPPTTKVVDNSLVETYDPGTMDEASTYYWKIVSYYWDDDSETGAVYSFTTSGVPPPAGKMQPNVTDDQGAIIKTKPKGMVIKQ